MNHQSTDVGNMYIIGSSGECTRIWVAFIIIFGGCFLAPAVYDSFMAVPYGYEVWSFAFRSLEFVVGH